MRFWSAIILVIALVLGCVSANDSNGNKTLTGRLSEAWNSTKNGIISSIEVSKPYVKVAGEKIAAVSKVAGKKIAAVSKGAAKKIAAVSKVAAKKIAAGSKVAAKNIVAGSKVAAKNIAAGSKVAAKNIAAGAKAAKSKIADLSASVAKRFRKRSKQPSTERPVKVENEEDEDEEDAEDR